MIVDRIIVHDLQALKVLRSLNKAKHVDVMPLAKLYAGLMCDRVTADSNSSTRYFSLLASGC